MNERQVVGLKPWLPWPFSAWRWWTEPVRGERLAALRIGLAVLLLIDITTSYWPHLEYFASDVFAHPDILAAADWNTPSSRHWALLRGVQHPLESGLLLAVGALATLGILVALIGRLTSEGVDERRSMLLPWTLAIWTISAAAAVLGVWSRARAEETWFQPIVFFPLVLWCLVTVFVLLEIGVRARGSVAAEDRAVAWSLGTAWGVMTFLLLLAFYLMLHAVGEKKMPGLFTALATPWNDSYVFLATAMVLWTLATVSLLVGYRARISAAIAWVLSMSFANLNPHIDNAGDVVRGITLFYLMLSPCAAAWSLDRRRQAGREPLFIHPWPLRLLFVQMVCIYFFNGLYKLLGPEWREGASLYYVLADLVLTRFSFEQLPLSFFWTKLLTWCVLVWEVGFPLFVAIPYVRVAALSFGVAFHAGIWLTMELGGFAPYMLALYLPLVNWEKVPASRASSPASRAP